MSSPTSARWATKAWEAYHNGYRSGTLNTRLGTLDLDIPKLQQETYFPSFPGQGG